MDNIYKVRCSPAAKILMGMQKQAIIEDAMAKVRKVEIQKETVVILQVNHLPLRIVVLVAHQIIEIITKEEADQFGISDIK
ncbi:MAG: hypothetical protein JNJ77_02100 [Planctomycetia bacterium]|nr:hypothetical protein [Planctomycetia bacterium]